MPARPGGPRLAPARPPGPRAPAAAARLKFRAIWGKEGGQRRKEKGGGGGGKGKKLGEGEERDLPFAEGGITWLRGCQSKRFCFILFVFATEAFRVGLARGEGGWAEGAGLSARRDWFMPSGRRADDCDAGLLKILLKDPLPHCPLPSSLEPLEFIQNRQTFPEQPPRPAHRTGQGGGGRTCAPPGAPSARGPASARSLPLQSRRTSERRSKATSSTENIGRPGTYRAAGGRGRRPRPGFISRESSSVRTRCQHSRTVYGIRIPQGGSSAVRVLAAIICRLSCRGVP